MSTKNTSSLAYAIFKRGEYHEKLSDFFEKNGILCPEDLFLKLRKLNLKAVDERYGRKHTKDQVGEYDLEHDELSLPEIVKGIDCWQYQVSGSDSISKSRLYRILTEFKRDCAFNYTIRSEKYKDSDMWG
jgi:hypothetical protein